MAYIPVRGGANKANRILMEGLAERNHSCRVVVPAIDGHGPKTHADFLGELVTREVSFSIATDVTEFRCNGVEVHAVTEDSQLYTYAIKQIREFEPSVTLLSSANPGYTLLESVLDEYNTKIVYIIHSPWALLFGLGHAYGGFIKRELIQQTAGIITVSKDLQERIRRGCGCESTVIPFPVYGPEPFPYLGCFDKGFVTIVNPCAYKGIAIFEMLTQRMPDIQFAAVPTWGTTNADISLLEQLPNVRIIESVDNIDKIFAQTKILLVPSLFPEGFPLIVVEAMLRGIPVLASDSGGLPEAKLGVDYVLPVQPIEQYEECFDEMKLPVPFVPEQDIGSWIRALKSLVSDRKHYIHLSNTSRQAALKFVSNLDITHFEVFLKKVTQMPKVDFDNKWIRKMELKSKKDELWARIDNLSPERRALLALKLAKKDRLIRKKLTITQLSRSKISNYFPLSFAQQRLWLVDQLEPNNPAYNILLAYRFAGKLDVPALKQSLSEIVRRHEILRTTFTIMDGKPIQVIAPTLSLSLPVVDLNDVPATQQQAKVQQTLLKEAQRPFDLRSAPLLRTNLLQLGEEEYIFIVTVHHIVSDGWSMGVFVRELNLLYPALSADRPSPLPDIPIQYADYTVWQRQWLTGKTLETLLNYWRKQLGEQIPTLELPTDRPRLPVQNHRGASQTLELSMTLTEKIKALSRQEGMTLSMTLLAAFKTLLHRLTEQDDIIVGSTIANRNRKEIEGLIGFFVNTLVLRTNLSGDPTFRELLGRVRSVALGAYANQELPFEKLVEELQPERDLSRSPLFQVLFNMLNFERVQLKLHGLKVEEIPFSESNSKFDLTMHAKERNQRIQFESVYNTDLFEDATISFMLDNFKTLLKSIIANPQQRLSELRLLNRTKRLQLTNRRNLVSPTNPFMEFKRQDIEQSIPQRFEQQAEKHPMNIAVKINNDEWTYEILNKAANRVAAKIPVSFGSMEGRIGLLFEHCTQMIIGIFAVLKAGKAYIPIDPSLPAKRIHRILNDSQIATLLTNNTNIALARSLNNSKLQIINVDDVESDVFVDNIDLQISPDTLAYILYTSGSTGSPKGVVQTHSNVLDHIRNYTNGLHISTHDRLTLFSNYGFDAAMMDIMGALLNGATLCPMDLREKPSVRLSEWLNREAITIYHSTPTVYRYLISTLDKEEKFPEVRLVVLGGEEVYKKDVEAYKKHFSSECIFVNTYGPTESTIALQYFMDHKTKITRNTVPIGYPVDNTEILLLNKAGEATDVFGEIAIRSEHIATGYWRRPEMMRKVFLPDPDGGDRKLYRTGDMGRLLPDGSIEFRGRKDFQVKIRGFRVEPAEAESALSNHEAIRECVVAKSDNGQGENNLIAYIVCNETLSSLSLRRYLKDILPDYMIPSEFIQLDAIPLIHNGKTDYASLSLLRSSRKMITHDYVPPVSPIEKQIAEIWQSVLGIDKVSLHNNFFDIGGHSLMVVRAISLIEKRIGIHMPFREFFNQTLRQFAASCEEKLSSSKHCYAEKQY
jgi:amino acid adenylation domain-containing protein